MKFRKKLKDKLICLIVILLLISGLLNSVFTTKVLAADNLNISGSLETGLVLETEEEKFKDQVLFNLVLQNYLTLSSDLYLDLQFHSYRNSYWLDNNFELQELLQSERTNELAIREAYLNYYTDNVDWRLGRQVINWGSSLFMSPTDYFNARDYTVLSPEGQKMGVDAVRGRYYLSPELEVIGVITPYFTPYQLNPEDLYTRIEHFSGEAIGKTGAKIYGLLSENNLIDKESGLNYQLEVDDIEEQLQPQINLKDPGNNPENLQGGMEITARNINGFDISFSTYRGRDRDPAVDKKYLEQQIEELLNDYGTYVETKKQESESEEIKDFDEYIESENLNILDINLLYPRSNQIGVNVIGSLGSTGLWSEIGYSFYEQEQFDNRLEATAGFDHSFPAEIDFSGEFYYQQGRFAGEKNTELLIMRAERPFRTFHEKRLNLLYDLASEQYLIRPELEFSLTDGVSVDLCAVYVSDENELQAIPVSNQVSAGFTVNF